MPSEDNSKQSYEEAMTPEQLMASLSSPAAAQPLPNQPLLQPPVQEITTAGAWKSARKKGFPVELPSGQRVIVRRTLDLFTRLKEKTLPNPLAGIVSKMIEEDRKTFNGAEEEFGEEGLAQMLRLFDETLAAMMIVPKCVLPPDPRPFDWEPPEDSISTEDVDLEDKVFLFNVAQGGVADVATFREQARGFVAAASDGGDVPVSTE